MPGKAWFAYLRLYGSLPTVNTYKLHMPACA